MPRLIIALLVLVASGQMAFAGPIEDQTKKAIELAKQGKSVAALEAMDEAKRQLWLTLKFDTRKALLVTQKAPDFGKYQAHKGNIYQLGSVVRAYVEPIGYGWRELEDGRHELHINADVSVLNKDGKQIFYKKAFGRFKIARKDYATRLFLNLSLNVTGLLAGDYTIEFILNDMTRPGIKKVAFPVKLVSPASAN